MSIKRIASSTLTVLILSAILLGTFSFNAEESVSVKEGSSFFDSFTNVPVISDVNGDGVTDVSDGVELKQYIVSLDYNSERDSESEERYDINGDGRVSGEDYVLLKQYIGVTNNDNMKKAAADGEFDYSRENRLLVWHDEFSGDTLNGDNWTIWRVLNFIDRKYDDSENMVVEDGMLKLLCQSNDVEGEPFVQMCNYLYSKNTMIYRYGYLEMRARVPFKRAAWPAWWMQSDSPYSKVFTRTGNFSEIDIFEVFSDEDTLASIIHKRGGGYETPYTKVGNYTFENSENLSNEFHIYGFEWSVAETKYYVDGECYCTIGISDDDEFGELMPGMEVFRDYSYIIFDNEIYSEKASGAYTSSDSNVTPEDLPIEFDVDWIRLYQNPETDGIHLSSEIAAQYGLN